jgi:hypothetical protein
MAYYREKFTSDSYWNCRCLPKCRKYIFSHRCHWYDCHYFCKLNVVYIIKIITTNSFWAPTFDAIPNVGAADESEDIDRYYLKVNVQDSSLLSNYEPLVGVTRSKLSLSRAEHRFPRGDWLLSVWQSNICPSPGNVLLIVGQLNTSLNTKQRCSVWR